MVKITMQLVAEARLHLQKQGEQGSGLNYLIKLKAVVFFFLFWNTWNRVEN